MIIKISKIINCSSEHPSYPSSNLLEHPPKSSWRCAKANELIATIIFQLSESSCITGLEIGNYRSCIVIVEASTSEEPDNWVPIINHQFLSHDEAANSKFRDQVQIFTKRELNPDTLKIKFDRVKVTCMQSANPRELFGLEFIIMKTEVTVDLGLDVFGRFKLKEKNDNKDEFKEKYLKLFGNKKNYKDELKNKIAETSLNNFTKKQEEHHEPKVRPILETLESNLNSNSTPGPSSSRNSSFKDFSVYSDKKEKNKNNDSSPIARTLFGDIIPSLKVSKKVADKTSYSNSDTNPKKRAHSPQKPISKEEIAKKARCSLCQSKSDELCNMCNLLPAPKQVSDTKKPAKVKTKPKKEFSKLFEDMSFSLSGYVNPQRDEIRRKALKMGAKYIADPNITNNKCTHLICAFKNTPKSQQLKGHCKIVSHKFIEDCYNKKKRIPWRRFALDKKEQNEPNSEEEIEGTTSPTVALSIYDQDTDDSDSAY